MKTVGELMAELAKLPADTLLAVEQGDEWEYFGEPELVTGDYDGVVRIVAGEEVERQSRPLTEDEKARRQAQWDAMPEYQKEMHRTLVSNIFGASPAWKKLAGMAK
jgi:hypothetical protein